MFIPTWIIITIIVLYAIQIILNWRLKSFLKNCIKEDNLRKYFNSFDATMCIKNKVIKFHLNDEKELEVNID